MLLGLSLLGGGRKLHQILRLGLGVHGRIGRRVAVSAAPAVALLPEGIHLGLKSRVLLLLLVNRPGCGLLIALLLGLLIIIWLLRLLLLLIHRLLHRRLLVIALLRRRGRERISLIGGSRLLVRGLVAGRVCLAGGRGRDARWLLRYRS